MTSLAVTNSLDFANVTSGDISSEAQNFYLSGSRVVAQMATMAVAVLTYPSDSIDIQPSVYETTVQFEVRQAPPKLGLHEHLTAALAEMTEYRTFLPGWDGEGSEVPSEATFRSALVFLHALPSLVSEPEAGITADGRAEWYWSSDRGVATVSILDRRLSYYARADELTAQSTIQFDGRSLPTDLLQVLQII